MSFIKRMLILIKLTFQTSRGGNMAPQWWKREGNGQNVKIIPVYQKLPQLYLRVNWANANLLRGFSELSMFNYKIKDYAPDIFFTYFLKARKLPLPNFFSQHLPFLSGFTVFVFDTKGCRFTLVLCFGILFITRASLMRRLKFVIPEMDFILVVLINWIAQLFWLVEYVLLVRSNGINN